MGVRAGPAVMALGLLMASGCATSVAPGTPMSATCHELPTVEECLAGAGVITDERLWDCVKQQCSRIKIDCGALTKLECKRRSLGDGRVAMGYTLQIDFTTPFFPTKETHWCEESAGRGCQVKALVHELAHSCGWEHNEGQGVPGNEGEVACE